MNPRTLLLSLVLLSPAFSQSPVEKAKADLNGAIKELGDTQKEYADLRRFLYRDINRLDDEALKLSRELRTLIREEDQRNATVRTLEREIEARKTDFNYSSGILSQYAKALVTRLHPAENQVYLDEINSLDQRAASSANDPLAELIERAKVLELGINRLSTVAGGNLFDGKALRNGSESIEGKLLAIGPAVYFTASNGGFEGIATFAETGTALPTVVGVKNSNGEIGKTITTRQGTLPLDGTMGKAIMVAAAQESLGDVIKKGGYVGYAILALGAVSLLIAAFKIFELSTFKVPTRRTLNEILDDLLAGKQDAAAKKTAGLSGLTGQLVQTGVANFYEKRRILEESLLEKLVVIKPILERFLPFLALTAAASPLMGLLGTVLGIIKTFQAMALYGTGNAKSFSAGISEALITTAMGLVVAIPILVIHGIMKSFVKAKYGQIEGLAIAMINGTTERTKPSPTESPSEKDDPDDADEDVELTPTPA